MVVQSFEHQTLGFSTAQDLRVVGLSAPLGLGSAQSLCEVPSPSSPAPPTSLTHALSLSL